MEKFIRIKSLQCLGLDPSIVYIETLAGGGLGQFILSGLPDAWLKDSREKIKTLCSHEEDWDPMQRILTHLLPPGDEKNGAHLELPIALSIRTLLNTLPISVIAKERLAKFYFVGALGLDGGLQHTDLSEILEQYHPDLVIGPSRYSNWNELWEDLIDNEIFPAPRKVIPQMNHPICPDDVVPKLTELGLTTDRYWERFWLYVAAVCELPVLMLGPPGGGKSHLASWAAHLIDLPQNQEHTRMQHLWKLAGRTPPEWAPVLNPHSKTLLSEFLGNVRGGLARPGLFSLAHNGLLILDEFTELNRDCREMLRTILDSKKIIVQKGQKSVVWPARFWLVATSNPCPCGYAEGSRTDRCLCSPQSRDQYEQRLSGPIRDRLGVKLFVGKNAGPDELIKCFWNHSQLDAKQTDLLKRLRQDRSIYANNPDITPEFSRPQDYSTRERKLKSHLWSALRSVLGSDNPGLKMIWETYLQQEKTLLSTRKERQLYASI